MRTHAPYRMKQGNTRVVCMIHGFIESPNQFHLFDDFFTSHHYDVYSLLLPGHGQNVLTFHQSNRQFWQAHVDHVLDSLRKDYDEIMIVAHSMGCLLALLSLQKNQAKISRLILWAPAIYIKCSLIGAKSGIKVAFRKVDDRITKAMVEAHSIAPHSLLQYRYYVPKYFDLFHLAHQVQHIHDISLPILLLYGTKDEFVREKSLRFIEIHAREVTTLLLPHSNHIYVDDADLHALFQAITTFIEATPHTSTTQG